MNELQKKSQSELIEIILRKDEEERRLQSQLLELNMKLSEVLARNKRLTHIDIKLMGECTLFVILSIIIMQIGGLLITDLLFGYDFPMSFDEYNEYTEYLRQNTSALVFYTIVSFILWLSEFSIYFYTKYKYYHYKE